MRSSSAVRAVAALGLLALVCASPVAAEPSLELGLKGGLALTKLSGSGLEESEAFSNEDLGDGYTGTGVITEGIGDMKPGFIGGAYATVHVTPQFGVRLEMLYSGKGGKGDVSGVVDVYDAGNAYVGTATITGTNTMTLDYFEIPILAVASMPAGTSSTFEVFVGPSLAFRTRAEIKSEVTVSAYGASGTASETVDVGSGFKSTDFGGTIGVGFNHALPGAFLFADARWTMGFTKIDDTGSNADWKNSAFGIIAGLGIPLAGAR